MIMSDNDKVGFRVYIDWSLNCFYFQFLITTVKSHHKVYQYQENCR
jgi:hypothetical protein